MEHGRIDRLLNLMQLLCSNVDYTIPELADRLETSKRTVFRYLDSLRFGGFTIQKKTPHIHKLLKMPVKKIPLSKLVHISEEEAYILHGLLTALSGDSQILINLEQKLSALFNATSVTEIIGNRLAAENIMRLRQAVDEKKQVVLANYESGNTMTISDRLVEPIKFSSNYTDVHAYEVSSGLTKVFKISRIGSVQMCGVDWQYEDKHVILATDCFRMAGTHDIPVTLKMTLKAKNLLIEEYPLSAQYVSFDGKSWWFRGNVKDLAGVGRFVIGLADQMNIIDSPALVNHLKKFTEQNLRF